MNKTNNHSNVLIEDQWNTEILKLLHWKVQTMLFVFYALV